MDDSNNSADHNPFAPPMAPVEDAALSAGELADRVTRLVANLIDSLIMIGLSLAVESLVSIAWPHLADDSTMSNVVGYGVPFLVFFGLQGWMLHRRGQTLGKAAMRIRIVRTDGSNASLMRLLAVRTAPMWLLPVVPTVGPMLVLLDALLIFRASCRCLHDDIADTMVVRA